MLGRPKDDFNVWVMGEVQVNNLGEVVQEEARKYVYVQELTAIKHLLEEQDRKVFRKVSGIDRHPLRGLLPKKKASTYNLRNQTSQYPKVNTDRFKNSYINRLIFKYILAM